MRNSLHFAIWTAFASLAVAQPPTVGNCTVLPADNIWNTRIDQLPVHPSSSTWVSTIGSTAHLHPDFGSGLYQGAPIGIPFVTVPGTQTKYPATFTYQSESDPGPYAIPLNAPIEGGSSSTGDRHVISVDTTNCILYEIYAAYPQTSSWQGGSGAIFNLLSDALRPSTWTSADAAGLPIFPGLVRYDEIAAGQIHHAIRFTVPQTQDMFVWPARHEASSKTSATYPPMGTRFRLKASFDISGYSAVNQIILTALKQYGMMLADNGSSWYISGAPDDRWNNDDLHLLNNIAGSNFEAVDVSPLMVDPNSGQASQNSVSVTVSPASTSVQVGATKSFSATVTGNSNQAVTWDVNGTVGGNSTLGFIDSISGVYTAPAIVPSPATVTVHASSQAVPSVVGASSVTITGSPSVVPSAISVTPSSGSGSAQTFAFVFSDPNGASDIVTAQIDIASTLTVSGACYLYYPRALNEIYLANDTGAWQGPIALGSTGTLQNSQCSINVGSSSATLSGTTLTLNLALSFKTAFAGSKNIYMETQNASHNSGWSSFGSWTVPSVVPSPSAVSVTPNSGTGASQNFAFVFTDPNGAADIQAAQVDISATLAVSHACYLYFPRALNEIYLASDTGAWQGPIPLGSTGTLQNSQCSVNLAASSATATGNTLTLNLALIFTAGFAGSKNIYMETQNASHDSGWSQFGTWTVAGGTQSVSQPAPVSVTPNSGSGLTKTFAFAFSDGAGAADIQSAQIDIASALSVSGACYIYYVRSLNEVYLANDTGTWQGPIHLGASGTLQNSQCILQPSAITAALNGNTLTLNLPLTFKSGFAGSRNVYAEVRNATHDSGWSQMGTWNP